MDEPVDVPLRAGFVRPVRYGSEEGPTRKQVRLWQWRRTSHGFYVPPEVDGGHPWQRIVEASVVVPARCAITGWAALSWRGGRWFDGLDADGGRVPVTVVVGTHDIRPQPGIAVSAEGFNPEYVDWVDGVPVSDVRYAVSFLMRYARSPRRAAAILDMAAADDLVSIEEQEAFLSPGQNGWTGVPQARKAIAYADENRWSPREVDLAHTWEVLAQKPRPLSNRPVFDLQGRHLGTPDVIDPTTGVIGEYDGEVHLGDEQREVDRTRAQRFRDHGLEPVVMTAIDLRDLSRFAIRLDEAYARAARRPKADRAWTLEPPKWWVPTHTVALRRALTEDQRRRFLRHRSA